MINSVQSGNAMQFTAAANLASGAVAVVGNFVGVVQDTVLSGAEAILSLEGVYTVPKLTGTAWAQGDSIYWDDTAKLATKVTSSNSFLGYAWAAVLSAGAYGNVKLTPKGLV